MDTASIQYMRLSVHLIDLRQSRQFATHILEKRLHEKKSDLSKLIHQAFNTSLIISYSRPFNWSKDLQGQRQPSQEQYINKVLNADEAKFHTQVIDKRNTVYGHSDARAHLLEGFDYNRQLKLMKYPYTPLDKSETVKLKIMINKWIFYLTKEQSKLKGVLPATHI